VTKPSLLDRLFDDARAVRLGDRADLGLSREQLVAIASEPLLLVEFRSKLERDVNDPELRRLILAYLSAAADDFDERAIRSEMLADQARWTFSAMAVLNVGAGAVLTATGLFTGIGLVGGVGLLAAGVAGVASVGVGTTVMRNRALKNKANAERLRRLLATATEKN
jgi:hypothetical protein